MVGEAYWRMGETDRAAEHFRAAKVALEERLVDQPDDPFVHQALSWAEVRLGDTEEAVRLASRATSLLPLSKDSWMAPDLLRDLAAVYTAAGRHEDAIDVLAQLLEIPSRAVSREVLRIDPVWDPLREEAGFIALLGED